MAVSFQEKDEVCTFFQNPGTPLFNNPTLMIIRFGLAFEENPLPYPSLPEANTWQCGPDGLLSILESQLGIDGHPKDNDYLRIEQYRQWLTAFLTRHPEAYFAASFNSDPTGTAAEVLRMRDELLLAGWSFPAREIPHSRLHTLNQLENDLRSQQAKQPQDSVLNPGLADRWIRVETALEEKPVPVDGLEYLEPFDLLPPHLQRLFRKMEQKGTRLQRCCQVPAEFPENDLGRLQRALTDPEAGIQPFSGDGSLLMLYTRRETEAATFLAQLFRLNPDFRPACLIPEKHPALDHALTQEGLPGMGVLSASLARPSLQILKLIPLFFWDPLDPAKLMEFVSLPSKPLEDELARRIARHLAERPGIGGPAWRQMIARFFEQDASQPADRKNRQETQQQYRRWFERTRYRPEEGVPREEVLQSYRYLERWAREAYEEDPVKNPTFLVLGEQARKVTELLLSLPASEQRIGYLQLERMIRTIYAPSPLQYLPAETGHLEHTYHPAAIRQPIPELLWWNCCRKEPQYFFSRWYAAETAYLEQQGCLLPTPKQENDLYIWQQQWPALATRRRLWLVAPETVNGSRVFPHLLHDFLEARFEGLDHIQWDLNHSMALADFQLPQKQQIPVQSSQAAPPAVTLTHPPELPRDEPEYLTQIRRICYHPHQWMFRQHIDLRPSPILSIVDDNRLMGNLAHRFFELLLKQERSDWTREDVAQWIDQQTPALLSGEGAVLLLYGREPTRQSFISTLKKSAWTLLHHLQQNDWTVRGTEVPIEGSVSGLPIRGRIDLLLERGEEQLIVDLKWRGTRRYADRLKNGEDLQLVLYHQLLAPVGDFKHTAYFIIDRGVLLARDNRAIQGAQVVDCPEPAAVMHREIWEKIQRTLYWRLKQLRKGWLEIRTEANVPALEEQYAGELMDLLELPQTDAPFDDYSWLVRGRE